MWSCTISVCENGLRTGTWWSSLAVVVGGGRAGCCGGAPMCPPAPGDRIPTPGATTRDQLARSLYSSLLPSAAALPTPGFLHPHGHSRPAKGKSNLSSARLSRLRVDRSRPGTMTHHQHLQCLVWFQDFYHKSLSHQKKSYYFIVLNKIYL